MDHGGCAYNSCISQVMESSPVRGGLNRVHLQCRNLQEFLGGLSPGILDRLYGHPATCLAVFRWGAFFTAGTWWGNVMGPTHCNQLSGVGVQQPKRYRGVGVYSECGRTKQMELGGSGSGKGVWDEVRCLRGRWRQRCKYEAASDISINIWLLTPTGSFHLWLRTGWCGCSFWSSLCHRLP